MGGGAAVAPGEQGANIRLYDTVNGTDYATLLIMVTQEVPPFSLGGIRDQSVHDDWGQPGFCGLERQKNLKNGDI